MRGPERVAGPWRVSSVSLSACAAPRRSARVVAPSGVSHLGAHAGGCRDGASREIQPSRRSATRVRSPSASRESWPHTPGARSATGSSSSPWPGGGASASRRETPTAPSARDHQQGAPGRPRSTHRPPARPRARGTRRDTPSDGPVDSGVHRVRLGRPAQAETPRARAAHTARRRERRWRVDGMVRARGVTWGVNTSSLPP